MPADRPHDVSGLTTAQLDRARRDLQISLAQTSPVHPCACRSWPDDRHRHRASPDAAAADDAARPDAGRPSPQVTEIPAKAAPMDDLDADYTPRYIRLARLLRGWIEDGTYRPARCCRPRPGWPRHTPCPRPRPGTR